MIRKLLSAFATMATIAFVTMAIAQAQFGTAAEAKAMLSAHPTIKGQQIKSLVDKNGKKLGEAIVAAAKEGQIAEVDYMWPRPGADTTPVKKFSYVTKVGDQVCGVGYYQA